MLRIVLWKICFEWANLMRVLIPGPDRRVCYLAFGANLSPQVLRRRKIRIFGSVDYVLEDAGLRFSQKGFYRHHGYASADHIKGEKVYGKLYLILESDARRMDYYEGVPFLDAHEKVHRTLGNQAFFYYRARRPLKQLKPTREYLNYLLDAYRTMPIVPADYVRSLERTAVLQEFQPDNSTGVLVRNLSSWPKIFHPVLVSYERLGNRTIESLWNRSLFQWMIRV